MSDLILRQGLRALISGGVTQLDDESLQKLLKSCHTELASRTHERDPRRKPMVGDVVQCTMMTYNRRITIRKVIGIDDGLIEYRTCDPRTLEPLPKPSGIIALKSWREWARYGKVLSYFTQ